MLPVKNDWTFKNVLLFYLQILNSIFFFQLVFFQLELFFVVVVVVVEKARFVDSLLLAVFTQKLRCISSDQ